MSSEMTHKCRACRDKLMFVEGIDEQRRYCDECERELKEGLPVELRNPYERISAFLQVHIPIGGISEYRDVKYQDVRTMVEEANETWSWRTKIKHTSAP